MKQLHCLCALILFLLLLCCYCSSKERFDTSMALRYQTSDQADLNYGVSNRSLFNLNKILMPS